MDSEGGAANAAPPFFVSIGSKFVFKLPAICYCCSTKMCSLVFCNNEG